MGTSQCSCVYVGDTDGPEFFRMKNPIARVEHKCCECCRVIRIGERYEAVTGKWDGSLDAFATCLDCISVRDGFFCDGHEFGGIWGALCQHIRELNGAVSSDCLIGLTSNARAAVCDLIEERWAEIDEEERDDE